MNFISFTELYSELKYTEDGEPYKEIIKDNITVPIFVPRSEIIRIQPFRGENGKLFKNVSIIKLRDNEISKVVGNYKDIENRYKRYKEIKGFKNET